MKFQVISGSHQKRGEDGKLYTYTVGDTLESDRNLARRFNRPGCILFKPVSEKAEVTLVRADEDPIPEDEINVPQPSEEEFQNLQTQADIAGEELRMIKEAEAEAEFGAMKKSELMELAEERGVDLTGCRTKPDIIKALVVGTVGSGGEEDSEEE